MTSGPLDGWDECTEPGCPSHDDNLPDDVADEFHNGDGWAHGVKHIHHIDHYLVRTGEETNRGDR